MPLLLAFNKKTYTFKARKVWGLRKRLTVTTTKKSRNWVIRSWQKSVRLVALVRCFVDDLTSKKSLFPHHHLFLTSMSTAETSSFWEKNTKTLVLKKTQCLQCSRAWGSFVVQSSLCFSARTRRLTVFPIQSLCSLTVGGSFRRFGRFTITAEWWIIVCGWGFMSPIIKR